MRIGFFADEYLPRVDGVITSMINSAEGLRALGHEVFFIVPSYPGVPKEKYVLRVPSSAVPFSDNIRLMLPGSRTKQQIARLNLDIIHSHTPIAAGQLARRAASDLNLPHIATFHTLIPVLIDYYPLRTRTYLPGIMAYASDILWSNQRRYKMPVSAGSSVAKRWGWHLTAAYADNLSHVISPSHHFSKRLIELGTTTPISVVSNSLNLKRYKSSLSVRSKDTRFIAVGRLSAEKRQAALITAAGRTKTKFHLKIIGGGPEYLKLNEIARKFEEKITLTGRLSPEKLPKELSRSSVGVLASHGFDNQPMTLLEYLASGLPILYCDPNLTEVIGQEAGLLVGPDPNSLAAGIDKLTSNVKLRQKMSKAALKRSKRFDHIKVAKQLESVYETLI